MFKFFICYYLIFIESCGGISPERTVYEAIRNFYHRLKNSVIYFFYDLVADAFDRNVTV